MSVPDLLSYRLAKGIVDLILVEISGTATLSDFGTRLSRGAAAAAEKLKQLKRDFAPRHHRISVAEQ